MLPAIANGRMSNNGNPAENGNGGNPDRPALRNWRNKLTILLIDESENHRILGTAYLTAYGVETTSVTDGRAALELIFSGARFSLILIDMHMRYMSGAQCVSHLRTMGVRSLMLGMTTFCREREERAFLEAGVMASFQSLLVLITFFKSWKRWITTRDEKPG
ncbi:putative response regulator and transcription factor RR-A-type family [Rosa chinensis]|uniref:Putative response regulator and transcription factor RR-A-type family n=2 Tax=Rosa chinensis TaxID=74649 RepID=A0A2P6PUL1_ROSCH|nr:uncharacterized protein LOC112169733 isoform X1 [Rosa chinensis]XP_040363535.1 uncharacterized protein LOC112169733 isoform X1 [Rosa chinensis]PRQ25612.1 putative response regulator and transcription factor RR-A-type family [Rosa chinensis]